MNDKIIKRKSNKYNFSLILKLLTYYYGIVGERVLEFYEILQPTF